MIRLLLAVLPAVVFAWLQTAVRADDAPASQPDQPVRQQIRMQVGVENGQVQVQGGGMVVGMQAAGGGVSVSTSRGADGTKIKITAGGQGSLEFVESNQGNKHLKIADAEGKELFDGDVNTAEQRKKVSPEAKAVFDKLKVHGRSTFMGGRIRIGAAGGMDIEDAPVQQEVSPLDTIFVEDAGYELSRAIDGYNVKVSIKAGKHQLVVKSGEKTVFDGPVDTAEQWAAIKDLPAKVVEEAKKMDKNLAAEMAEIAPTATSKPADN